MVFQLEHSSAAERQAQEILIKVLGSDSAPDYSFDHPCPETKEELEIEVANCELAMAHKNILPKLAVGVIRGRYRVAYDRHGMLCNPAFRKQATSPSRKQYDDLRARMVPLELEPEWLDLELQRHDINIATLEGWTQEHYKVICNALSGLEKKCKELDANKKSSATRGKKKEQEVAVVIIHVSESDLEYARGAFNFLDKNQYVTPAEMRDKIKRGKITEAELEFLMTNALEAGWDPDSVTVPAQTEGIASTPEIPFLLDVVQPKDVVAGEKQPQEVDRVAQPETTIANKEESQEKPVDVETVPSEEKSNVDAVALPAVVDQHKQATAGDAVQLPAVAAEQVSASVVIYNEQGQPVDSETGEILKALIPASEANAFLETGVPDDARACAIRVVHVINRLQHECEDIAAVACGMVNQRLRGINGLLYFHNATLRGVFEPELKKDKNGKFISKSVPVLDAACKVYFEKTGGIKIKDPKELTAMLEAMPEKEFLALGGKIDTAPRRVWDVDELKKLYKAEEPSLQPYFETKKEDEYGILKVGTGKVGWTPNLIAQKWKPLAKLPMLTAATEDPQEAESGESAA